MAAKKLVFVEDDPDDREMIEDGLKKLGVDDYVVFNGSETFYAYLTRLAATDLPEAIVLDINMPKLTGIDILKVLKSTAPYQHVPIYIFTCAEKPALKKQCTEEGVAGYYIKPDNLEALQVVLQEICTSV